LSSDTTHIQTTTSLSVKKKFGFGFMVLNTTFNNIEDSVTITVIAETIRRRSRISKEHAERCIEEYSDTYALKVCGCDLFL
jgi:L-arabinose isomerase